VEETTLRLCAIDHPVVLTFTPVLSPTQYSELAKLVMQSERHTARELCDSVCQLAHEWGVGVKCDDCT
jgi:hypothetical protein